VACTYSQYKQNRYCSRFAYSAVIVVLRACHIVGYVIGLVLTSVLTFMYIWRA